MEAHSKISKIKLSSVILRMLFTLNFGSCYGAEDIVEIQTTTGKLVGEKLHFGSYFVNRYLGIPYARPPVEDRRFRAPEPAEPWQGTRDAKNFSARCAQYPPSSYLFPELEQSQIYDEDCLYLNVYTPGSVTKDSSLPVMVWIHGGSLLVGAGSQYYGEPMVASGEVILVTFNYRLDIFGFFVAEDEEDVPGNAGFQDQIMVLEWVRDNIREFGGNPDMVTIFGESAGGWSVCAHMISPLSVGLFRRAISQSGALYTYPVETNAKRAERSKELAKNLNCSTSDHKSMMVCLRSLPPSSLIAASYSLSYTSIIAFTIDGVTLPDHPTTMWQEKQFHKGIDYITGMTSEESTALLGYIDTNWVLNLLSTGTSEDHPLHQVLLGFAKEMYYPGVPKEQAWEILYDHYFTGTNDPHTLLRQLLDLLSHTVFLGPISNHVSSLSEHNPTYLYYFSRRTEGDVPYSYTRYGDHPHISWGAEHGSELGYTFGYMSAAADLPGSSYNNVSQADRDLGKSIQQAWISFAKTGTPVILLDNTTVQWPRFNLSTKEYVHLDAPMSSGSLKTRLMPEHVSIFRDVLPAIGRSNQESEVQKDNGSVLDTKDSPSLLSGSEAEAAFFILLIFTIVVFIFAAILLVNFCAQRRNNQIKTIA